MANKPVSIEFIADVAKYLREVKKMEVSTEDVADALVATTNSADDLERKLGKAMKDSAKDTETLERALKDIPKATEKIADESKKDFDKFGDEARRAGDEAGQEMGQEFKQNLGESLASGDLSTIIQDTAGGLVSGLSGPLAAAAAGVAGIAAVGFAEIQKQIAVVEGFVDSLRDSLNSLYTQGIKTQDAIEQLDAFNQFLEDQSETVKGLKDDFDRTGISSAEYLTSIFKGGGALEGQRTQLEGILATMDAQALVGDGLTLAQLEQQTSAAELLKYLDAQSGVQEDIAGQQQVIAGASQLFAENMGLVDRNADGVIDASDQIAVNMTNANWQVQDMKGALADMQNLTIPVHIKYDATGYAGGAFGTTSGGRLTPVYQPTPGASG